MKTKKKNLLLHVAIPFLLLAAAATGIYLWLFAPKPHAGLVPGESRVVAVVRIADLPDPTVAAKLSEQMVGFMPEGIDLAQDVYLFLSPNGRFGMAAAVKDFRLLSQSAARIADTGVGALLKQDGQLSWVWLDEGWLAAWNEKSLLIMGPGTVQERPEMQRTMKLMFKAADGQSFRHTAHWDELQELPDGAARLYARMDAIPSPLDALLRIGMPSSVKPADMLFYATLQFQPRPEGEPTMSLQGKISSDDEATRALLQADDTGLTIANVRPREIPDRALAVIVARTEGDTPTAMLREDPVLRGILLSLDGTLDAGELEAEGGYDFTFCIDGINEDEEVYFCIAASQGDKLAYRHGNAAAIGDATDSRIATEARGNRCYATFNLQQLAEELRENDIPKAAHMVFGDRKRATLKIGTGGTVSLIAE